MRQHRAGFTLVEILVVLAVIAILSALLFPVFNRVRESGRQTNCASNLSALYKAVLLYRQDEQRYPNSIYDLLPANTPYPPAADAAANSEVVRGGAGYLKGGNDALVCPSDDTESPVLRSSYGNIARDLVEPSSATLKNGMLSSDTPDTNLVADPSRWVFNAYGYDANGWAYTQAEAQAANGGTTTCAPTCTNDNLANPKLEYNFRTNPVKYSLSNRNAPTDTIITHCIFHRTWTSNLDFPGQLADPSMVQQAQGARDIILRLDGKAKVVDVSSYSAGTPSLWQRPKF